MQIISSGRQFACNDHSIFWDKEEKYFKISAEIFTQHAKNYT